MHDVTRGGSDLPWPSQWRHRRRGALVVQLVFLGLVATAAAGGALVAAASGDLAAAAVAAGLAGLLMIVVGGVGRLSRTHRGTTPTAVTSRSSGSGDRGACLPYSAWWFGWMVTLVAVVAGLAAAVVALGGAGQLGGDPGGPLQLLLLAAAAVLFCGWFVFDVLRGRIRRGYVLLTPTAIHHRGLVHAEVVPWRAVRRVSAFEDRSGPMVLLYAAPGTRQWRATSGVGLRRTPPGDAGAGVLRLPGRLFAVDPAVLLHAIDFYLNHPQARAELAGEAGVARIRTGNLLFSADELDN